MRAELHPYLKERKLQFKRNMQLRMLRCIASGLTNAEMAVVMKMSPSTAETYRMRLMKEMGATNSCQMLKKAYDYEWLKAGEHYENGELKLLKAS